MSDLLVANGHVREYYGGTRQRWCGGTSEETEISGAVLDLPVPPDQPDEDDETGDPNHPLTLYDDNGRISCAEARAHGIAPVTSDHPAYPYMTDADREDVVCE